MVTPPRFEQPPRRRESRTALWVTIILACVLLPCLCVGGFIFYGYHFVKNNVSPIVGCEMTFEGLRDSMLKYAEQNGGRLPNSANWQEDIKPYYREIYKTMEMAGPFKPVAPDEEWRCVNTGKDKPTGIAFNAELSEVDLKTIQSPWNTVLLFETEKPVKNEAVPYAPKPDSTSPMIFGTPRGWIVMMVEGEVNYNGRRSSSSRRNDRMR